MQYRSPVGVPNAVREDVAEVRAARARSAPRCAACRALLSSMQLDGLGAHRLVEARPSAVRVELRAALEQLGTAGGARVQAGAALVEQLAGPRALGRRLAQHLRTARGRARRATPRRSCQRCRSWGPPSARVHSTPLVAAGLPVACGFTARMRTWIGCRRRQVADRYATLRARRGAGRSDAVRGVGRGSRGRSRDRRAILGRIPETHRQPPLVFAVTRCSGAPEAPYREWAAWLAAHADEVVAECSAPQPADERAAAVRGAAAGAERHRRPDRPARGRRERRPVPVPRPLLVPLSAAGRDLDPRGGHVHGRPAVRRSPAIRRCGCRTSCGVRASTSLRSMPRMPTTGASSLSLVWPGEDGSRGADRGGARHRGRRPAAPRARRCHRAGRARRSSPRCAPRGRDARDHDPGRAAAHPARRSRAAASRRIARAGRRLDLDRPARASRRVAQPPVDPATWGGFVLGRDGVPLAAVDPLGAFVEWRGGSGERRGVSVGPCP